MGFVSGAIFAPHAAQDPLLAAPGPSSGALHWGQVFILCFQVRRLAYLMRFIVTIFYTLGQAVALRSGDPGLISRNEGHFEVV